MNVPNDADRPDSGVLDDVAVNNALYLERRGKIVLPAPENVDGELLPLAYVMTASRNLETLGYGFSAALMEACRALSLAQLTTLYESLVAQIQLGLGAHREHRPMYPNFPAQVMEMDEAELYLNALVHYWTEGKWQPETRKIWRLPLKKKDQPDLKPIDIGTRAEFEALFAQIAGGNSAFSAMDKAATEWFVSAYGDRIAALMPEKVPQKENIAALAVSFIAHTSDPAGFLETFCRTATDVLRLAVALSGGDVSLAAPAKFRTFARPERVFLLTLLERIGGATGPTEDMLRRKKRWLRLGEKLHPGEYRKRFPITAQAFDTLRNDLPFEKFNTVIEVALAAKNANAALERLVTRPGDFARRLDHLLRVSEAEPDAVLTAWEVAAPKVSTPVLLQVRDHFARRQAASDALTRGEYEPDGDLRVFFPKGNIAKAQAISNTIAYLEPPVCARVVAACEDALVVRFSALPSLGNVYVDPQLANYKAPFALRSASKTLRTLVRGSRLPLPEGCAVLRFFVWWKNGKDRTDIDLSAALFGAAFNYVDVVSYYNLESVGGVHSGDIVDAPEGASEFIDITLEKALATGARYVVMSLNSYSQQPFIELPECFAGWMARSEAGSSEIYEPKTVQDKLDVTADTKISIPLVIDMADRSVIWCDMALRNHPQWQNHVAGNLNGISATLRAFADLPKPNLYDLFALHARARGTLTDTPDGADTVFSVEAGTPFRLEEIAADFMA